MNKKAVEEVEVNEIPYPIKREGFFGNGGILEQIKNSLLSASLSQTLIISGPPSVGKTSLAYIISSAIECENGNPFACGECRNCKKIKKGIFPDLRYITLLEDDSGKIKTQITIDQVREEIIRASELPPYEGNKLIFIVEPSDSLNASSQNALLKLLEEPPSFIQIILIAKETSKLLPTVRSRCPEIKLKEIPQNEMVEVAKRIGLNDDFSTAVSASRGRAGLLISGKWKDYINLKKAIENLLQKGRGIKYFDENVANIESLMNYDQILVLDETLFLIKETLRNRNLTESEERSLLRKYQRTMESMNMIVRNVNLSLIYNYIFLGE